MAEALPLEDFSRFQLWREAGHAGEMRYLIDRRGDLRSDPRNLLPSAQSIVCVGKLYNPGVPARSVGDPSQGRISRYAGQGDYHEILRDGLQELARRVEELHGHTIEWRVCVDTAPLLERSYARAAGLGWIGKNTCLINQEKGSWFFLGELLLPLTLTPDLKAPDRCGTCTRCIDACPTSAIINDGADGWSIDARKCISYLTIEKRGVPDEAEMGTGNHVFGCDICQDVCPWNGKAPVTDDERFAPVPISRELKSLAALSEEEFRAAFRDSPVWRAKYEGFLRNVAVAIGNSGDLGLGGVLDILEAHFNDRVAAAAKLARSRLRSAISPNARSTPVEIH